MWKRVSPVMLCGVMLLSCGGGDGPMPEVDLEVSTDITERRLQFAKRQLTAGVSHLSDGDRRALAPAGRG